MTRNTTWLQAVGARLRRFRGNDACSKIETLCGIHHHTIAEIEAGAKQRLGLEATYTLARTYDVHLRDLLAEPGSMELDRKVAGTLKRPWRPWDPTTPHLPDLDVAIRLRIRELRKARAWGTPRLANETGLTVSQKAVHRLEAGQDGVSLTRVRLLATALGTTVEELIDWRPHVDREPAGAGAATAPHEPEPSGAVAG